MTPRPFDPRRPFSRADAIAAGVEPRTLRTAQFRRIFRGVYIAAGVTLHPDLRAEAALVPFHPTAFASHASAARIHRVPLPALPDEHVTVVDRNHRRNREGIRCHEGRADHIAVVHGVRVSSPTRAFVELAELVSLVDLVIVGDHLARRGVLMPEDLRAYCASANGRGATLARTAARYVRERVDSPMETRLRMLLALAGLPEPEVNVDMFDRGGRKIRCHDLSWRRSRTALDYDGRHHIERESQWESDIERREASEDDGWRDLTATSKSVFRTPEQTVLKVARVLRDRGEPGVPRVLSDAWRPHFPSNG